MSWRRHFSVAGCLKRAMVGPHRWSLSRLPTDPGWTVANSANVTLTGGSIESVSCSAANACTAVGSDHDTSGVDVTLAERWNGTDWQREATPNRQATHLLGRAGPDRGVVPDRLALHRNAAGRGGLSVAGYGG